MARVKNPFLALSILLSLFLSMPAAAQPKQLTDQDYGKWERLGRRPVLSPDGKWLAVQVSRVDGSSKLELHSLDRESEAVVIEEGGAPEFSEDSKWLAYSLGYSETAREKMRKSKTPIRQKMALRELASGEVREYPGVERFSFSDNGLFLAALQYLPEAQTGEENRPGAPLLIISVAEDSTMTMGNVSEYSWQDGGALLALAIQVESGQGNGVQLLDTGSGRLKVLDSGENVFSGLHWREESDDLAYFRQISDEAHYEKNSHLIVWRHLASTGSRKELDPGSQSGFPADHRVVAGGNLIWPADGQRIFLTVQDWVKKEGKKADSSGKDEADEDDSEEKGEELPLSDVQVWHSQDERIFPMQELQKNRDRNRGLLTSWDLETGSLRVLGTDQMASVTVSEDGRIVIETDENPYAFDNQFDRPRRDVYSVNPASGAREKAIAETWFYYGISPKSRYLLYFSDDNFVTYDLRSTTRTNHTSKLSANFVNEEYDTPVRKQKPPWGFGGWLADEQAFLIYDRYDVWWIPLPSGKARKLTAGEPERLVYRTLNLDPDRDPFDPTMPLYFSVSGEWSKKSGFARLTASEREKSGTASRLLLEDAGLGGLVQAEKTPVMVYTRQTFRDSPDYFVSGPDLKSARQVTHTNPFQSDYHWGRAELIEYESEWGKPLQGALYYPADYQPGRRYPMIVYVYERLSQGVHSYEVPSERSSYNTTVWTSQGYFVLEPDIAYKDRDPGISAVECVRPAVQTVVDKGIIDPARVGLIGHSWGGYEASFIPTQTDIFATSIAGAPLTNFFSMFGTIHWNQGMPESSHFETGQARMEVPYWEDMEAYIRNSPVMHLQTLNTPMLIFFGDGDGTVDWHQGVELYNYARRADKFLVMLVYPGENHSARQKKNQVDYHHRVLEWFGHFLKGEEAPAWIVEGMPALQRERRLK